MIRIRRSDERGHFDFGWLKTYHTFSFGQYHDPKHLHFRSLRVINEDWVAPGQGFDPHPHRDMEIITYIVEGALKHGDDSGKGNAQVIRPGEVQRMSAGTGIVHSEHNASATEPVHLLQIWIIPDQRGHAPGYDQKAFPPADRHNRLRLVASPDGSDGSLKINQDARMYAAKLDEGASLTHAIGEGRGAWVQVVDGEVTVNGQVLHAGDAAAVEKEPAITLAASRAAELIVFDLS
ncbi:MAG: pirin family protein [Phycisphaerales bacterium]|nr:pirin family protein [Phycisphaerales bacterium]